MARPPKKRAFKRAFGKKVMKPPKESGAEVWSLLKKLELADPEYELTNRLRELNVQKAWADSVGDSIARKSAVTTLARGTLHVTVESPAWRNELVFIEKDIIARVNERYRELLARDPMGPPVKWLRLSVGALPTPPPPPKKKEELPPATADETREVEARLDGVKDPELREAARRFLLARVRAERAERAK